MKWLILILVLSTSVIPAVAYNDTKEHHVMSYEEAKYYLCYIHHLNYVALRIGMEEFIDDNYSRQQVVKALGYMKPTQDAFQFCESSQNEYENIIILLTKAINDRNESIRRCAVQSLKKHHAVDALIMALSNENSDVRESAALALGELGDTRAVEPLIKLLEDQNPHVQMSAVLALGDLKDPRAVEPLIKIINKNIKYWKDNESMDAYWDRFYAAIVLVGFFDPRAIETISIMSGERPSYVLDPNTIPSQKSGNYVAHNKVSSSGSIRVVFPDQNLETAIRKAISKPTGPIYVEDLDNLTTLNANNLFGSADIKNITGLEYCRNLRELYLPYNQITDVSPLSGLTNLTWLDLRSNHIIDVSPLSGLINLQELKLSDNHINDISPLSGLDNLQGLDLRRNNITDISPLSGLTNLQGLDLSYNRGFL